MGITNMAVPANNHSIAASGAGTEWRRLSRALIFSTALPALVFPCASVFADHWTITRRVSVRETYTNNVRLGPEGQERSDWVTDVNAGVTARGRGPRVSGNFAYNLQGVVRSRDDTTTVNHQLQANGTAVLIKDRFFLDAGSSVSQTNKTNTGSQSLDTINVTGNEIDTITYSVSPHARQPLGRFATASARYTFDEVINRGDAVDSRSNRINVALRSGSWFTRLGWSISYTRQHIENRDIGGGESETDFERVNGTVSYQFSRKFSAFASAGWDWNDFASVNDDEGFSWRAGGTWTPSRRTSATVSYGERFFGKSWNFSLNHRRRRTIFNASLTEDETTVREIQLQRVIIPLFDPFGNPIVDPLSGAPFVIFVDIPTLTDEVFIQRRLEGSITLQGVRTTVTLRGFHEQREFQRSGEDETVRGASGAISRSLSPSTSVSVTGLWQTTDLRDGVREDTLWQVGTSVTRQIGKSVNGGLQYRRTERDSNMSGNAFIENRAMAFLSMSF